MAKVSPSPDHDQEERKLSNGQQRERQEKNVHVVFGAHNDSDRGLEVGESKVEPGEPGQDATVEDKGGQAASAKGPGTPGSAQRKFLELDFMAATTSSNKKSSVISRARTLGNLGGSSLSAKAAKLALKIVQSKFFTPIIASAILLNAVFVGIETDFAEDDSDFEVWFAIDVVFSLFFLAELCVRYAAALSWRMFLADRWNIFDVAIVALSCFDNFILTPLTQDVGQELVMINSIRVIRLLRLARMVRLLRLFSSLWLLVAGIIEAFGTLMWAWVLLGVLIYIFGIATTRLIGQHSSAAQDEELQEYFGTLARSMFTLFSVTTTEGWAHVARTAMKQQPWTWMIFILYLYVTTFAVMNVVVAVIVENTLDQAGAQREKFQARQRQLQQDSCVKIYKVFSDADTDGNGEITLDEFNEEVKNPEVRAGLQNLGIDLRQAANLFTILDYDESGALDAEEFVGGMLKAIGSARAKDVLAVDCDTRRMGRTLQDRLALVVGEADRQMAAVETTVEELSRDLMAVARICAEGNPPICSSPSLRSLPEDGSSNTNKTSSEEVCNARHTSPIRSSHAWCDGEDKQVADTSASCSCVAVDEVAELISPHSQTSAGLASNVEEKQEDLESLTGSEVADDVTGKS